MIINKNKIEVQNQSYRANITTGPILTKILHDIVALMMLLNLAYTRHYPIPFPNGIVTK